MRKTDMKNGTAYIQREDRGALNRLRLKEFDPRTELNLNKNTILWNQSDDRSHVLGVWKHGELISSMRLELVHSTEALCERLEIKGPLNFEVHFPAAIFSKSVTAREYRGLGLNTHLRYHLLNIALTLNAGHIFGLLIPDSQRVVALKEMGYDLSGQNPADARKFIVLNLKENERRALTTCAKLASSSLLYYPWISSPKIKERSPCC